MTNDDLDRLEAYIAHPQETQWAVVPKEDVYALITEVRRLRADLVTAGEQHPPGAGGRL